MDLKNNTNYKNCSKQRVENCLDIAYNANTEIASTSSHQLSNGNPLNKRKRKSTVDEKDTEFENPVKKVYRGNETYSQSNSALSTYQSSSSSSIDDIANEIITTTASIETRSSSDCLSTVSEYDLGTPCSSTSQNDDLEHDSISLESSSYHSNNSNSINNENNWHQKRGDVTPCGNKTVKYGLDSNDEFVSSVCVTPTSEIPMCPLPALSWANALDVWNLMCRNDEIAAYDRSSSMLKNHPGLQPRMRAILLDWLIEVCEVYKLHRETYYLAVDYLDRYLTVTKNVQKTHLQLIGITCLFVAAKVEEIYPPKIGEFAYVTDGACQEEDILQHELLLLKALDWDVSPVTIMGWLGVYMQLNVSNRTPACFSHNNNPRKKYYLVNNNSSELNVDSKSDNNEQKQQQQQLKVSINNTETDNKKISTNNSSSDAKILCENIKNNDVSSTTVINDRTLLTTPSSCNENDDAFIYPQFSGMEFVQTAQLLDLCSLDVGIANYRYSVIAAAAMSLTFNRETALRVSGYDWNVISPCVKWMEPFFSIICEESQHVFLLEQNEQIKTKFGLGHICPNIVTDDSHIIQTHTTSVNMFDKLVLKREQHHNAPTKPEASPGVALIYQHGGLLTPPASSQKSSDDDDENNANEVNLQHVTTS